MSINIGAHPVPLNVDAAGVVRVGGTRVTLDLVVEEFQDGATPEEIARGYPAVTEADAYTAIGYYLRHRVEVDAYLAERRSQADEVRRENEARFDPQGIRDHLMARAESGAS